MTYDDSDSSVAAESVLPTIDLPSIGGSVIQYGV